MTKTLLITGGSRGIGAATARLAIAHDFRVAINYLDNAAAADALKCDIEAAGGNALTVQGDVAKSTDVARIFAEVERSLGPVDALVNSAGLSGNERRVAEFDVSVLERMLAVNITGTILCCREAVRRMSTEIGGRGGVIVNVSSMAATIGGRAGASDYAASKAAVDAFSRGLAKEVGDEGIRVNVVRPGMTLTDMAHTLRDDPTLKSAIASTIPMNRIADADEIARPILWLLGDDASFISGACVDASGGGFIVGSREP